MKQEDSLLEFINPNAYNKKAIWANGQYGRISYTDDDHYRFIKIDKDEEGNDIDINNSDAKRKQCPIVANGIIASWFLHRETANNKKIFYNYLNNCKERIKKEEEAKFRLNIPQLSILLMHLKNELALFETSIPLFEYITPEDKNILTQLAKGYICYVLDQFNFENNCRFSKDEILTLLYLSNHSEEDVENPFYISPNIFVSTCNNIGEDYLYIASTNDGYFVQIKEEGLGVIESLLDGIEAEEDYEKDSQELKCNSNIIITEGKRDIFIKNIISMNRHGIYSRLDGSQPNDEELAELFGQVFGQDLCENLNVLNNQDKELIDELMPIFYNVENEVVSYIEKLRTIANNTEKAQFTADLVKKSIISDASCRKKLWEILVKYRLYDKTEENWSSSIRKCL